MICCTGNCKQGRDCPYRYLPKETWIERHFMWLAGAAITTLALLMFAVVALIVTY